MPSLYHVRMTEADKELLVQILAAARREGRQIDALAPGLVPPTPREGYDIHRRVADNLSWPTLGWKIAATTPEMQRRLRATEPIYGRTFAQFAVDAPAAVPHAELLDPIIECEFLFRLARDLAPRDAPFVKDEVAEAVAAVHAGIEIAECRFPLDRLPPMPAILADGAASGRYVIGDEIRDWRTHDLAQMPVSLTVNGTLRRHGAGHEVMGDPMNALVWLANERRIWGDGLRAGELISSGTASGMLLARAGDRMRADFGGRWGVEVAFEA